MKKLILLFALILITSCSKDDTNYEQDIFNDDNYMYFDPPAWLWGTWTNIQGDKITFTRNNLIFSEYGNPINSANEEIAYYEKSFVNPNIQETAYANYYSLKYNYDNDYRMRFNIIQVSERMINISGLFTGTFTKN
ncbi:hypothetical protein ACQKCJ_23475 [Flavobacterium sp. NPDC079362]|uniref:hypothetical protein n=1 Tax=Flavobacterium sp. NPDC079362 TaxID=3390566 RepID=UPI003D0883DF